jgi:ATP-binding cassette subfamily B (MDR/TAP) protein 10
MLSKISFADARQTAEEKLNAFKTVAAYNSQSLESGLFGQKVDRVFTLARKEAYASGIFWGASGLTGNLAMLCLLGYGERCLSSRNLGAKRGCSYKC